MKLGMEWFRQKGWSVPETNAEIGQGGQPVLPRSPAALKEKMEQWKAKGLVGRPWAMVVGVPNVGKSAFINQVAKRKKSAKAGAINRASPGGKQWVKCGKCGLDLWIHPLYPLAQV